MTSCPGSNPIGLLNDEPIPDGSVHEPAGIRNRIVELAALDYEVVDPVADPLFVAADSTQICRKPALSMWIRLMLKRSSSGWMLRELSTFHAETAEPLSVR